MYDNGLQLILASASPRRRELLGFLGVTFSIVSVEAEEHDLYPPADILQQFPVAAVDPHFDPTIRAWRKAVAVQRSGVQQSILGADTIVVFDGLVMNKPVDANEAFAMLARLAGGVHQVFTGLSLLHPDGRTLLALERSDVVFHPLSDTTIAAYVSTGEPLDKAGAYGIQGQGGELVQQVRGSFTNVVGLPLGPTYQLLQEAGYQNLVEPAVAYQRWFQTIGKEQLPCPPTLP
jgi:septum formation protein